MPSASQYVRPGPSTANAVILRKAMSGSYPPIALGYWWIQRVRYSDYSDADTSQSLSLNVAFPHNAFPAAVFILPGAYIDLIEVFAGGSVSAATMILGDTNDDNGLLTSSNVFTGATLGRTVTPTAAEYPDTLYESQYVPLLQLDTTTDNIDTLTSGIVDVYIPFMLAPTRRPVTGF